MTYIDGFLTPVKQEKKDDYVAHAEAMLPLMKEFGALRMVECWGDDLMKGKQTDFYRSVAAEDGETVVFSWIEWPDRASRDKGWAQMMQDPRMADIGDPPFDGKRMIWSGFAPVIDSAGEMA